MPQQKVQNNMDPRARKILETCRDAMLPEEVSVPVTATHDNGSKTHFASMRLAYKYAIDHPDVVEVNVDLRRNDTPQEPITFCKKQDGYGNDYLVYVPDEDELTIQKEPEVVASHSKGY